MRNTDQYLALIPPLHADKPKFTATVAASVQPFADIQTFLAALTADFDLDTAVGVQLDAVGVRAGRSRLLPYPLQGIFFSFDDPARGFDKGIWKGPYSAGIGQSSLDDDTYRRLLRAIVLGNQWDGTVSAAQAILDTYFIDPTTYVFVEDNGVAVANGFFAFDDPARGFDVGQWALSGETVDKTPVDMGMVVAVAGNLPNLLDLGLMGQSAFPIKPEGVSLEYRVTSINGAPLFGFDVSNQYVAGFDQGAFGVEPDYIAANVIPQAA